MEPTAKAIRGFALLSEERRREISSKGGKSAHEQGKAHKWTPEEASAAGKLGGVAVSADREHMRKIGLKGGLSPKNLATKPRPMATALAALMACLLLGLPAQAISPAKVAYKAVHYGILWPTGVILAGFGLAGAGLGVGTGVLIYKLAVLDDKLNPEAK